MKVIYSLGNMTNSAFTTTGGPLDNWDAKLFNIKSQIKDDEWKEYITHNCFQDFLMKMMMIMKLFCLFGTMELKILPQQQIVIGKNIS